MTNEEVREDCARLADELADHIEQDLHMVGGIGDAVRILAKWLNEEQTAPIDRIALAFLLAEFNKPEVAAESVAIYQGEHTDERFGLIEYLPHNGRPLRTGDKIYASPSSCPRCASLQAKIDSLMLEYCPDEMTPEQIEEWGNHQVPAEKEAFHKGMLAEMHRKRGLMVKIAALEAEVERLKGCCSKMNDEIMQTLGKALGYPWYKDDQKNFPGATEVDGICPGDNVAECMAMEAATKITTLEEELNFQRNAHNQAQTALLEQGTTITQQAERVDDLGSQLDDAGESVAQLKVKLELLNGQLAAAEKDAERIDCLQHIITSYSMGMGCQAVVFKTDVPVREQLDAELAAIAEGK